MLNSIVKLLDNILEKCIIASVSVMLLVIFGDILMREIFNKPLTWHLEVSQFCLIITTYLGAALAYRKKQHISVDIFTATLNIKVRSVFSIFTKLLTLPFLFILVYASANILEKARGVTPTLQLPIWIYYSPIFIGSGCLAFYGILSITEGIRTLPQTEE